MSCTQDLLFEVEPMPLPRPAQAPGAIDLDRLAGLAFCYTATFTGKCSGVRFAATIPDAQAWCSSPLSQGVIHGTPWAYHWTSVTNYLRRWGFDDVDTGRFDLSDVLDDGSWDDRIASTGCVMIRRDGIAALLADAGVRVS